MFDCSCDAPAAFSVMNPGDVGNAVDIVVPATGPLTSGAGGAAALFFAAVFFAGAAGVGDGNGVPARCPCTLFVNKPPLGTPAWAAFFWSTIARTCSGVSPVFLATSAAFCAS